MDITVDMGEYILNVRAAGIITHNGKVLLHKSNREKHYALLGGRVMIGENSENTLKREVLEETGKQIEITGYISTIENFFEANEKKYHEIMFVHQAEFIDEEDKKIIDSIKNIEGRDYLQYEWLDINELDKYDIRPKTIKDILKENKLPVHRINQ